VVTYRLNVVISSSAEGEDIACSLYVVFW